MDDCCLQKYKEGHKFAKLVMRNLAHVDSTGGLSLHYSSSSKKTSVCLAFLLTNGDLFECNWKLNNFILCLVCQHLHVVSKANLLLNKLAIFS